MPELKNKTILILSPQSWGKMFISKHHYAIELSKRGNTVFFLNPPDQKRMGRKESIEIKPLESYPNLFLVEHKLFFPYRLKFKALPVFHWLMKFHIQRLLRGIGKIDIIWSFDLGNLYPLPFFRGDFYKIFHPVDEPLNNEAINAAKGADVIFSVTREILEKYGKYSMPRHFINHGIVNEFIAKVDEYLPNNPPHVGFSGNLLRPEIDWETVIKIVEQNPTVKFHFWGSYKLKDTNIGGSNSSINTSLEKLINKANVKFYGPVSSSELAKASQLMDAFLICYDVQKDQSRGTNYHKVMEHIATGKVIISNNITTYKNQPDFVQMIDERENNNSLPKLFSEVINNLKVNNELSKRKKRILFANDNLYENQVARIESLIANSANSSPHP